MLLPSLPDKHPLFSLISYMVFTYNFDSFTSDTNKYFIFMLFKYLKIDTRQREAGFTTPLFIYRKFWNNFCTIYIYAIYRWQSQ